MRRQLCPRRREESLYRENGVPPAFVRALNNKKCVGEKKGKGVYSGGLKGTTTPVNAGQRTRVTDVRNC